jgi:hypothetical protein
MTVDLECRMDVAASYALGEPILVTGRLQNAGATPVWVLIWRTFLEGMRTDFAVLERDGIVVPYGGFLGVRGHPSAASYRRLDPGESVSARVDLAKAYPIADPGSYSLQVVLHINDAFSVDEGEPPRRLSQHAPTLVESSRVPVHVTGDTRALPPIAQAPHGTAVSPGVLSGETAAAVPTPQVPVIVGANSTQTQQIVSAHNNAYATILLAQSVITADTPAYETWFGPYSNENVRETVRGVLARSAYWMANKQITYDCTNPGGICGWDDVAKTSWQQTTIYLCGPFFSSFWGSTDPEDQQSTIVHEVSHAGGYTNDIVQGESASAALAQRNPRQAANNGANYAFFSAAINPGPSPNGNGMWQEQSALGDSTTGRPAAAVNSRSGLLMIAYQDSNFHPPTGGNPWLWFKTYNIDPGSWNKSSTIMNPTTNDKCKTSVGPALAAMNGVFYCVYVDWDPSSPLHGFLVYIATADNGATWSTPAAVLAQAVTLASPALATFNNTLYCVYGQFDGSLMMLTGAPTGTSVAWTAPQPVGVPGQPYTTAVEPGLAWIGDTLYCMYARADGVLRYATMPSGGAWSSESILPLNFTNGGGIALLSYYPAEEAVLLCLYPGKDQYLRYTIWDGHTWFPAEFREADNYTSNGPALAAMANTVFAVYKGGGSNQHVQWAIARAGT